MERNILLQNDKITIRENPGKRGIEVLFPMKPDEKARQTLKDAGFRWSRPQQLWWAYDNERTRRYVEEEISYRRDMKKLADWEEFRSEYANAAPKEELEQKSFFSPESYLATFREKAEKLFDNTSFNGYIVNSNTDSNRHIREKEAAYESDEGDGSKGGQSDGLDGNERGAGSGGNHPEFAERNCSQMDGNSGSGHAGDGHGDSIPLADGGRAYTEPSPINGAAPDGQIPESPEQDAGDKGTPVHSENLQAGRVVNGVPEHHGGAEQPGHGDGITDIEPAELSHDQSAEGEAGANQQPKLTKSQARDIRSEIKRLLESRTDEEIKNNPESLALLAQYEGGGGLKEQDATSAETLNAFYTPRNLVRAVWKLADFYAPDAVSVLEPSSGIGRFAEDRSKNKFTLRELDPVSARIARILHPDAEVIQGAFQSQFYDESGIVRNKDYALPKYDLVIGNPPYGAYSGEWKGKGEGREFDRVEEYFIKCGLDSLKDENSLLAFVVPSGFLNSSDDTQKHIIAERGQLVGAFRLPEGVFSTTQVGTDIIMKKYAHWYRNHITEAMEDDERETRRLLSGGTYFKEHPENILGEIKTRTNRFGKEEEYVALHEGLTVQDELDKIGQIIGFAENAVENVGQQNNESIGEETVASQPSQNEVVSSKNIGFHEFRTKKYPYINGDGTLNADRLRAGDIIIGKEDGIPYSVNFLLGDNYLRVDSVTMKKDERTGLFEEFEEQKRSDEKNFALGGGWKSVLNEHFLAPSIEKLENWEYPSWYKNHLDYQEKFEGLRDEIRKPLSELDYEGISKNEMIDAFARTCAKELDFLCGWNDTEIEERADPATGKTLTYGRDEYGYARVGHELAGICDFYGSDLVLSIIVNSANYMAQNSTIDKNYYERCIENFKSEIFEKAEEIPTFGNIKDIVCSEEKVGKKFPNGNTIWDLYREYQNLSKDRAINPEWTFARVLENEGITPNETPKSSQTAVMEETEDHAEKISYVNGQTYLYAHEGYAARVCHAVKEGNQDAVRTMAAFLAGSVSEPCVLVPIPQHTGKAEYTLELAKKIQRIAKEEKNIEIEIADVLSSTPHETLYEQKKKLRKQELTDEEINSLDYGDLKVSPDFKAESGKKYLALDNVYSTGKTFEETEKLIPGINPLVFAVGHRGKEKFLSRFGLKGQVASEITVPETKPEKKTSYIELALQAARNKPLEISQNEDVREFLGIQRDIKTSDFYLWSRQQWSNSHLVDWYFQAHFDISTRQLLITTDVGSESHREKVLLGSIMPDGQVIKAYDEYSDDYQSLRKKGGPISNARQERLDSIFRYFSEKFLPVMDTFLGTKDGKAYFASIESDVPKRICEQKYHYGEKTTVFSSERLEELNFKNPINAVVSKDFYPRTYTTERDEGDYESIAAFVKFKTLFPEEGGASLSAFDEDNSVARLAGDEVEIPIEKTFWDFGRWSGENSDENWEKYKKYNESIEAAKERQWNTALDEVVRLSGFKSQEEYFAAVSEIARDRAQKRLETLEARRNEVRDEQDMDIILNEILRHEFKVGQDEFSVSGYRINFSQNKDDHSAVDVLIDGKNVLTVNEKETTVTSHGNFRVTPNFITKIKERWESWPTVADEDIEEKRLSLNKMLMERHFSKNDISKGTFIAETFIGQSKNQGETYEFERDGEHFIIRRSGTVHKVYQGKSNYPLFEFDFKSNILKLYQESYENGTITAVEEAFCKKYANLTVIKDIVIDKNRYVDTNGSTIVAPAQSPRYTPSKEKLLSNAEFAEVYGKKWDAKERAFWAATDRKGYVDTSKLTVEELQSLERSDNYVLDFYDGESRYIHKELYTSGNIYEKLDRLETLHADGNIDEEHYRHNKDILTRARPVPKRLDEIEVSLISPFVAGLTFDGKSLKNCFIDWATGCGIEDSANTRENISDFADAGITRDDIPATITWSDVVDYADGNPLPAIRNDDLTDEEKSQIRNQKINDRKETAEKLFNRFLHTALSPEQKTVIVDSYNRRFNSTQIPDYSRLPLFIDGMNMYRKGEKFRLYEQQIKGISFLCNKGNGILAYDVGVGKTAAGIVATVQQIQSGRALRPLIIVPKSVIGKWESDIHELFPNIPVNNLGNFSEKSTGAFYDKKTHGLNIPAGSITLVTKDALNNLHWDKDTVNRELFKDYADLLSLNDRLVSDNPTDRAAAREKIYEQACGKAGTVRDSYYVEWNATEFDHVTVDEAHAFKNLFKVPRPKKGETRSANEFLQMGSGEPSKRALKMFNITQLIQRRNEDRNVFMLTATPFTNSPLEVYSMLVYVARKELEEKGIKDLYDFCAQYAKTRFERVVTAKDVKYGTVMKEFGDLPGLQNILKQYIDKVDGEEAGIIRPDKATHEVYLAPSDIQKQIFEFATETLMEYKPESEDEKRAPILEAMSMLRTACLSPALVKQSKLTDPNTKMPVDIQVPPIEEVVTSSPKLKLVCDTVIKNWKKYPDCGQVIYMPEGTDAYPYVIRYMKNAGIPANVFASIDGSEAKIGGVKVGKGKRGRDDDDEDIGDDVRAKVAEAFNDKRNPCKILIGSSAISEGMDLNGNSIALYNTMLGWNPTESVQVEGRIWRQGNEQGKVHIVYPLIYDSIDSLLFQKHDEKQSRINDLFSFKGNSLNVADINPEELKYALIKNPVRRAKIEIGDIAAEKKKEILLLDNQLQDFDQLCESRIKWKEKLSDRESSKQAYIANHHNSLFKGNPNRSEEEQKEGVARFDKSIEDCKKQLENIRRKLAEMGIKTRDDEANFADKVNSAKREKENELSEIYDHDKMQRIVDKYRKMLEEEKTAQLEKILTQPLEQEIQNDMVPMHIVERRTKEERYQEAMRKADGNKELQKELTDGWNDYLAAYDEKWNPKPVPTAEKKPAERTVVEQPKETAEPYSIVRIIKEQIEEIDEMRNSEALSQGFLFGMDTEPLDVTRVLDNTEIDWGGTTAENFSDNLEALFEKPGQKITREAVLKSAYKLLNSMPPTEKEKFLETARQMDISSKEKSDAFFMDMARGKVSMRKNKLQVVAETVEEPEYDIF